MTWKRKDHKTICDGHVVRYQCDNSEISASRNAVMISGFWEFRTEEQRDRFLDKLKAAWQQYKQLKLHNHKPIPENMLSTKCCDALIKQHLHTGMASCAKCETSDREVFRRE